MKNRYRRLAQRYKGLRTRYKVRYRRGRGRVKSYSSKLFTMRWFKNNWAMILIGLVVAYFVSPKFKVFADDKVLNNLKKKV